MITHAAVVWWPRVELGVARAMLSRVQRLACLAITGAIRTSPTAALEVITGLLPLNIHIKQVAMTTSYRIKRVQNLGSHSHILEKMHKEVPFTGMRGDHMKTCFLFDKEFKIAIPARESWNKDQKALLPENSRTVYTVYTLGRELVFI